MTTSQSYVYKGSKAELHDDDAADRMKAEEGWFDNPADAANPPKANPPKAESATKASDDGGAGEDTPKPAAKKATPKKPSAKKAAKKASA